MDDSSKSIPMDSSNDAPQIGSWSRVVKGERGGDSKKYHYSWVFDEARRGLLFTRKIAKNIRCSRIPITMEFLMRTTN